MAPIETLDRDDILDRAKAFKPKGETPLVYSALQAPADLKALGGGTVIVITDGEESCKGDPVKAAAELKASGLDIRLNIVGFAVTNPEDPEGPERIRAGVGRHVLRGAERRRAGRRVDDRGGRQVPVHRSTTRPARSSRPATRTA